MHMFLLLDQGGQDGESEGGGRERPPPGLKGREIGMWYAKRGKARKEREEKMNVSNPCCILSILSV